MHKMQYALVLKKLSLCHIYLMQVIHITFLMT